MNLHNIHSKEQLQKKLSEETFGRFTLSFYRYVKIKNLQEWRDKLYIDFAEMQALGRIYVAHEGINAQMSIPDFERERFLEYLDNDPLLVKTPIKWAVEDSRESFIKLIVRKRDKIVADGITDPDFDPSKTGQHLSAAEFNACMELPDTIVVDMRNHYESEIGHFEGAYCPDADTFRDEIAMVEQSLADKKDQKILMYCTGGIRCEKASAYLKYKGFTDVNQLSGGIIDYARQVKELGIETKFAGKNFVFDQRLGEDISGHTIARCHQCGTACDSHTNCANNDCHLLFIQCPACAAKFQGTCSTECKEVILLPEDQRSKYRIALKENYERSQIFRSRLRPQLLSLD